MSDVILFGELMLRLSPEGFNRIVQSNKFNVHYGGSEANVAVSLANYEIGSKFVTKLPNNEIGQSAFNKLREFGVDVSDIIRGGERLGIYYLEKGASQRPSKVIYDREYSSIAEASLDDFNWDDIFKDAKWFHFSGITPSLSGNLAKITLKACIKAKELGLTVSCDLNYRAKLWSEEKANEVMSEIMEYVDICIANEEDIEKVFQIKATGVDVNKGQLVYDSYNQVAKEVAQRFNCSKVACTLRTSVSASDNKWAAILFDNELNETILSTEYDIHIVDRVGGGDSFVAGLIYGFINNFSNKESLEFATAASCLKHSIEGDFNMVTVDEVNILAKGNSSGRVQR